MGCGASSKAVSVIDVDTTPVNTNQPPIFDKKVSPRLEKNPIKLIPLPVKKNKSAGTQDSGINSHLDSDEENIPERGSISSDSNSNDLVYKNVINDKSNRNLVENKENKFIKSKKLDLETNKEDDEAFKLLKSNGLVPKPVVLSNNYALFEIVEDKKNEVNKSPALMPVRGPPPRLTLQKEKTKTSLTAEEIEEKLEKANQRKKENLKLRVNNGSISIEKKDESVKIKSKLNENQVEDQELLERQQRLKQLRDKLKAKDAENTSPRTPRSKELINELDKFRPKTASNFRPEF
ncbi:unnamed protein product [Brachionus calyciflorus]|uniref:Uncharacterized protein n=1 Tax=Brachionus calyciflorus TaxID=104777 RepID=A0A813M6Y0_9BILA|nr:unnamed protein product [Brachionus calyciflorus]